MNLNTPTRHGQTGLTLIELMVAMILGLLLMTGIIQVFLASKQTLATNEAISEVQESGRFALSFITRSLQMGGYINPTSIQAPPFAIRKCESASDADEACARNGAAGASDQIAIALQPPLDPATGKRYTCAGDVFEDAAFNADEAILVNRFWVDGNVLKCRAYYYEGDDDPTEFKLEASLVDGVERLQVLYGINTEGPSEGANQYVSADRVETLNKWDELRAVRLAVLARSQATVSSAAANTFVLLDATPVVTNDNVIRQVFTSTVQLKNTY